MFCLNGSIQMQIFLLRATNSQWRNSAVVGQLQIYRKGFPIRVCVMINMGFPNRMVEFCRLDTL